MFRGSKSSASDVVYLQRDLNTVPRCEKAKFRRMKAQAPDFSPFQTV